ncbi:hypothetical protein [Chamaesiphon minutus]|uniref:hypothetical protein n=1 Tax=Chamaesiphon minutus TaxID=1173032 RepID=UPI0003129567|nr:hypothetical protein [Chamaesiphon minutus]
MNGMQSQSTPTAISTTKAANSLQQEQSSGVHSRTTQQWENILVEEIQAFPGQEQ